MVLDTILVCVNVATRCTYREGGKGKIRALYLNTALPPFVISIVDPYLNFYYKVSSRKSAKKSTMHDNSKAFRSELINDFITFGARTRQISLDLVNLHKLELVSR